MKTKTVGILMALVLAGVVSLLWAQVQTTPLGKMETKVDEAKKMISPADTMKPEEGKRMMRPDSIPKGCPACGAMMHIQMLATEDGHLIVLVGNTLQKYDADLQLVKEAELKIDMQKMHQHMQDMMKSCPMQNCPMMQK